jgi:site-specific recombinase XerD
MRTAIFRHFFDWCDERRLELAEIEAIGVATYIKQFGTKASNRTVKQHLAAIRQLFDYLSTKVASWRSTRQPRAALIASSSAMA